MKRILLMTILLCGGPMAGARGMDLTRPPGFAEFQEIEKSGWSASADRIEAALAAAYEPATFVNAGSAAKPAFRAWQLIGQWCRLLATRQDEALRAFLEHQVVRDPSQPGTLIVVPPGLAIPPRLDAGLPEGMKSIQLPPDVARTLLAPDAPTGGGMIADLVPPALASAALRDTEFLRLFFRVLAPEDHRAQVLQRLGALYAAEPGRWTDYRSLAVALAVVYDQALPAEWPHSQAGPSVVPWWNWDVVARYRWLIRSNEARRLDNDLRRLSPEQLKFVVDAPVLESELVWAQSNVRGSRESFGRVFSSVAYDQGRVDRAQFDWPHGPYLLDSIRRLGGICVDQAYFAALAGKARGIPTLLFAGQGTDGGHAWFGFLRGNGRWELDAGRYENQQYTVGTALDPQTWRPVTDHELQYLAGRLQRTGQPDAAAGDLTMAAWWGDSGDASAALRAVDSALRNAPGSVAAWEAKAGILQAAGRTAELAAHYQAAAEQFRREEDLRARYTGRLAALLRSGGDAATAARLQDSVIRQNRRERTDLSTQAGAEEIARLLAEGDFAAVQRRYKDLVGRLGRQGGGNFFYGVVRPTVLSLLEAGKPVEARRAFDLARRAMPVEPGSILEREFEDLAGRLAVRR